MHPYSLIKPIKVDKAFELGAVTDLTLDKVDHAYEIWRMDGDTFVEKVSSTFLIPAGVTRFEFTDPIWLDVGRYLVVPVPIPI